MLGWAIDVPRLTSWNDNGICIQPNSAVAAMAASAALVLKALGRRRSVAALGLVTLLIGATVIVENLTGLDFGVDTLLMFHRPWGRGATLTPGRMGLPASISWTLVGAALLLFGPRRRRAIPVLGLLVVGIAGLSLTGVLFGADLLYTLPRLTAIASQTATFFVSLGLGLIASEPDCDPMRTMMEDSGAGILARRALPLSIVAPILLGLLGLRGQSAGLYDTAMGTAALVLVLITLICAVLWWGVSAVGTRERALAVASETMSRADLALRESEARVVATLEGITDGFVAFDREWRFVYINGEAARILGMDRTALLGTSLWAAFPELVGSKVYEELHRAAAERIMVDVEDYHALRQRWFSNRAYPTVDGGLSVYFRDITEKRAAEDRAAQGEQALRDANRRKDEFLAMLAHELRNPLAPLVTALETLKRPSSSPAQAEKARGTMQRQLEHMVRLIDDLLDVSRITHDKLELRRERLDLSSVVQQAVETYRLALERAGHELRVSLPEAPLPISGDPARLAQVIGNLLTNAGKFSEPGGGIVVTVVRDGAAGVVVVKDAGVGIPPEMLDQVFEMFTQLDRSLARAQGGLGIGLSLVRRLVELHGGTVTAHSEGAGRGSELVVRLPVLIEEPAAPLVVSRAAPPPRPARRVRILVVDDNRDAAESLASLLEDDGSETQTAHDGVEAVDKAAAYQPDVILLDLGLPRRNGYEVCRAIRAQPWGRDIVVMALTGWGHDEDRARTREAGFDCHLVKPVNYDALARLLAVELARSGRAAASAAVVG